jgi:uncharacterized RDD family membrane protein YckC
MAGTSPTTPDGLLPAGGRGGDVDDAGLVTPEAVVLGLPIASVGSRGLALVVDLLIQGSVLVLMAFAASAASVFSGGWVATVVLLLVVFAVLFVYPAAFETFWQGRTPGKAALGLRVVTVEAGPVGLRHAAIRSALGVVDFWVSSGGVAVLSALFTRRAQRLGDLAAGTVVVREGRSRRGVTAVRFEAPPGTEDYARRLDVSALDEDDYGAIRSVLVRATALPPATAQPLAAEAVRAVRGRFTPGPPSDMPPLAVLTCLAAAYQQRHRDRARTDVGDWIWQRG